MRGNMKVALVALALAGGTLTVAMPAVAREDVNVQINPGSIAWGYSDGYWDREHQWHAWRNQRDAEWYRSHYRQHYYGHRHDRDHDEGWREADRWWDRH